MPTICQCFVLINNDNPEDAQNELEALFGAESSDPDSPILDFTTSVEGCISVTANYDRGELMHHIPPQFSIPASQFARPC